MYTLEQRRLMKEANELIAKIESNIHFIVNSIKAKKLSKAA